MSGEDRTRVFRHACNKKTCPGCMACAHHVNGPCRLCSAPNAGPCVYCGGRLGAVVEGATTHLLHIDRACRSQEAT